MSSSFITHRISASIKESSSAMISSRLSGRAQSPTSLLHHRARNTWLTSVLCREHDGQHGSFLSGSAGSSEPNSIAGS